MTEQCGIVQDLLPLYADGAASPQSARMIEAHLAECRECSNIFGKMQEGNMEQILLEDTESVVIRQQEFFKRRSARVGMIFGALFMIPVLICLIISLSGGGLSGWFFVVLCSMLVAASAVVVPLVVPEDKALWTICAVTASLILLLAVTCLRTGGAWFFRAALGVLLGFAVVLLPIAVRSKLLSPHLKPYRALLCVAVDSVLLFLLVIAAAFPGPASWFGRETFAILFVCLLPVWAIFFVARYLRTSRWIKAAAIVLILIAWFLTANRLTAFLAGTSAGKAGEDPGYTVGDAVITDPVDALDLDWSAGEVTFEYGSSENLTVSETVNGRTPSKPSLEWKMQGSRLTIRKIGTGGVPLSFNFGTDSEERALTVTLPAGSRLNEAAVSVSSADVRAEDLEVGRLSVFSSSGEIRLDVRDASDVCLESSSGSITAAFARMPAQTAVVTSSGDVKLYIPERADFTAAVETASGDFSSSLPVSSSAGTYVAGSGTDQISIETSSGNVTISGLNNRS